MKQLENDNLVKKVRQAEQELMKIHSVSSEMKAF